jgi:hypothetical protein
MTFKKLVNCYGLGFYIAKSPSAQDPAGLFGWIITLTFGPWVKSFTFGGNDGSGIQ